MLARPLYLVIFVCVAWLGQGGAARAEGLVEKASKNAAKGVLKGAAQEINTEEVVRGAKEVTKSVIQGAADAAPQVTSQIANQANVNRKALGRVARQVTSDAVSGAVDVTMSEVQRELGPHGDGPLAVALTATTERLVAGMVRGVRSEAHFSPPDNLEARMERLTAAVVRGAASQMSFSVWPYVLAFVIGGISTLLCGVGLMLLYLLFQRRRASSVEPMPASMA